MKRLILFVASIMIMLAFTQCKSNQNDADSELTNRAIEAITNGIQLKLDSLTGYSIADAVTEMSEWLRVQDGVVSVDPCDHFILYSLADGTHASVVLYDENAVSSFDTIVPQSISGKDEIIERSNPDVIGNHNVLIFDPFNDDVVGVIDYNDLTFVFGDNLETYFTSQGCNVVHLKNEECNIGSLAQMTQYGSVLFITHGHPTGFATGEVVDPWHLKYKDERRQGTVGICTVVVKKEGQWFHHHKDVYSMEYKYIQNLNDSFNNALILNCACDGFVDNELVLRSSFINKGASKYLGFDNSVNALVAWAYVKLFTYYFVENQFTADESFNEVIDVLPYAPIEVDNEQTMVKWHMAGDTDLSWNAIPDIPTDGLVAYYPFNGNANDESVNGNDGLLCGDNVPELTSDRHGRLNNAYQFGGYYNPNWIKVSNSESLMFDHEMTISFWIQQENFSGMDGWAHYSENGAFAPIAKGGDGNATYPGLHIITSCGPDGEGLQVGVNNSNGNAHNHDCWNFNINATKPNYGLGDWIHIVLAVSDDCKELYINGLVLGVDELNKPSDFSIMNQQDLYIGIMADDNPTIGGYGGGFWYPFNGKIDDIRIYNRKLSTLEIKALGLE